MRKKSHIALAKYLVRESRDKDLKKHKYAFYLGSVLPDIKPSFIYRRHEITETFPALKERIRQLSFGDAAQKDKSSAKYYRHLGEISHYVADYFTYPHNRTFMGGLREHCSYEEELKQKLRQYISSGRAASRKKKYIELSAPDRLFDYLKQSHQEYLMQQNSVEDDINHIIPINSQVIQSISNFRKQA